MPQKKNWTSYFKQEEKENPKFSKTTSSYTYTTSNPLTQLTNRIEMRNDELGEFFDDIYDNFSDLSQIGPIWESYKF